MTTKNPDPADPRYADETLFDGMATRKRYSPDKGPIKSAMWLKRRQADPNFPKPVYIGIYPHYRLGGLRWWEDCLPTTPPASQMALGAAGPEVLKAARERKKANQGPTPAKPGRKARSP
jgi:hypothetical protein